MEHRGRKYLTDPSRHPPYSIDGAEELTRRVINGPSGDPDDDVWVLQSVIEELQAYHKETVRQIPALEATIQRLKAGAARMNSNCAGQPLQWGQASARAELAAALEARGILARAGVHCAPLVHKAIGTFPAGTCRISFGPFMREDHIRRAAAALFQLAEGRLCPSTAPPVESIPPAPGGTGEAIL